MTTTQEQSKQEDSSAEEVLRARFAQGEIDTAAYKRSLRIICASERQKRKGKLLTRRQFLGLIGLGAGAVVLGGYGVLSGMEQTPLPQISPATSTNRTREYSFTAAPMDFDLGGQNVATWGYNGTMPGPEIRLTEGDTLRVTVQNGLPEETTIHWHGVKVPNAMDGVPTITQLPIKSGDVFTYEFPVPTAGSYIYHSHAGLQLDRGLYGPLIIEPTQEELSYDREYTLLLDDWLDGVSGTPDDALKKLQSSGGMGGMMGGGAGGSMMGGGGAQDGMMNGMMGSSTVAYPYYLINGRTADDPETLKVRQGEKIRLRLMNPAAETTFRFAVAGHKLSVTHADGLPVEPVAVDAVRIGMGERYDVLVEANNPGVWQVAASPEGKSGMGRALLRYEETSQSSPPSATSTPSELKGRILTYKDLSTKGIESFSGSPDRTHALTLSGGMMQGYEWTINGQAYPNADPLPVQKGEWVRLELRNMSMMAHPLHLHGHFFQVAMGNGLYKDTALIDTMGRSTFDFVADNPGEWVFHCHNLYHMESGMMRVISYET